MERFWLVFKVVWKRVAQLGVDIFVVNTWFLENMWVAAAACPTLARPTLPCPWGRKGRLSASTPKVWHLSVVLLRSRHLVMNYTLQLSHYIVFGTLNTLCCHVFSKYSLSLSRFLFWILFWVLWRYRKCMWAWGMRVPNTRVYIALCVPLLLILGKLGLWVWLGRLHPSLILPSKPVASHLIRLWQESLNDSIITC